MKSKLRVGRIDERRARSMVRKPYNGVSYSGMGHEDASRLGSLLVDAARDTECWRQLPEHLIALRVCLVSDPRKAATA